MSLITPEATLSFPALFSPRKVDRSDENETPRFSATFIFDDEAQADPLYAAMKQAALEAGEAKFGAEFIDLVKAGKLNWPFLAGEDASAPKGTTVIRTRSLNAPGVVGLMQISSTDTRPAPITDQNEMYAGARVRASVGVFAYDKPTNKGVAFGLNNVQKIADGERLDGRVPAADEFEADASLAADLSAMDAPEVTGTDADGQANPPAAATSGKSLADLL